LKDPAYAHLTANILLQYCHNWIKNECFDEAVSILDEQISSAALLMSASVDNLSKFMIFNSQCNVRIKKNACNVPKKFKPLNPFDPDKAGYVGMRKVIDKKVGIGEGGKSDLPTTCKDGKECNEQPIKDGQKKVEKKSTKKKGEKENPVPGGKGGTGGNKKYNGEEVCSAEEMATIALKPSTIDTQIALFTCDIGNAVVSREDLKIIQRATLRYMLAFANQLYKLENKNETSDHKDMAILSKDFATTQTKLFTELLEMEGATPPAESEFKNLVAYLKNIQTKEDDDIFFEIIAARKHKESEFRQKVCALVTNLEKEVPSTMTYWPREIADCSFDD
jgi:hypothetical protein